MIWTLTTYGKTEKAYATLRLDYQIDDVVKASETGALGAGTSSPEVRANKPPVVKVQGAKTLTTTVDTPVALVTLVTDDGIPKRRAAGLAGAAVSNTGTRAETAAALNAPANAENALRPNRAMQPPARATVGKNVGLHLSLVCVPWLGAGDLRSPAADGRGKTPAPGRTRRGRRSGQHPTCRLTARSAVHATFSEPGTYILRGLADDGALTGWDDVTVTVTR